MSNAKTKKNSTRKQIRADRIEEILQEALKSFAEKGFRGTTTASIAASIGLTEPGVLHYFPSKAHLLKSVLEYRDQQEEMRYADFIDSTGRSSLPETFGILENLVSENEEKPGLIQLFTVLVAESLREDHPAHEYFVKRYRRARLLFKQHFSQAISTQAPADIDIDELVTLIIAVMDGLQIQWLLDPNKVDMPAAFKLFSKIVGEYWGKK